MTSLDPPAPAASTPVIRPRPPAILRGWVFFLVTALAVLAGSATPIVSRPVAWSAEAIIAFVPVGERPVSASSVLLMVPRYVAYAASPYVVRQVAAAAGLPATELQDGLSVAMPATTANVAIRVSARTPATASEAANRIAALVIERAAADPVLGARMLADAPVPADPSGPGRTFLLAGAGAAAMLAGALAALAVQAYVRRRYPWAVQRARAAGMPPRRPVPGGGLAMGSVPRPNPDQIGSTFPRTVAEPDRALADTVEMPAIDDGHIDDGHIDDEHIDDGHIDDEDTVAFDPASVAARAMSSGPR